MGDLARATAPSMAPKAPPAAGTARSLRGHIPALDGVRGLAVLMVLVFHFVGGMEPTNAVERAITKVTLTGALGVELFFVLSGFLITGILYDSRPQPHYFRNFYMRRFLRIFPLYYGVLAVLFLVVPRFPVFRGPDLDHLVQNQTWAWLYGVNVYIAVHERWAFTYLDHFWSLCVEEHFYFAWPFVVWALARWPRRLMWVSLGLSLGAMAARFLANLAGVNWWTIYVLLPFRFDGLAMGAFLAMAARQPEGIATLTRRLPHVAGVAFGLLAASFAWVKVSSWGLTFVYNFRAALFVVLLACLLMWAVVAPKDSRSSRFFRMRTMTFLGTYSYGIYVYHHFVSYYMAHHRTEHALAVRLGSHLAAVVAQGLVGMAVTVVVAYASYNLFEKRFLSLKRLFEPAR